MGKETGVPKHLVGTPACQQQRRFVPPSPLAEREPEGEVLLAGEDEALFAGEDDTACRCAQARPLSYPRF
jgi:hypothetical protein